MVFAPASFGHTRRVLNGNKNKIRAGTTMGGCPTIVFLQIVIRLRTGTNVQKSDYRLLEKFANQPID